MHVVNLTSCMVYMLWWPWWVAWCNKNK